ncbi:DUF4383 domain-containing protein [Fodinisporobacter ferrooxydans]|uniref:DUF4383 domain-containing protein n=1 Tax=Fodinisporobacter ferrooxydans TaxID=2901836 RepID=A0ABY4CQA9_9BACL|nr:DUF4383 domain-containing protein [Alicyclobacillaceae bacterium MYW30-H2]
MKQYARIIGWIFLLLGILSAFTNQIFGIIQFDLIQNLFRFAIGLFALAVSRPTVDLIYAKTFCIVTAPTFLIMGIASFIFPQWGSMHFEAAENLLHVLFGIYGLYLIWNYIKEKTNWGTRESSS